MSHLTFIHPHELTLTFFVSRIAVLVIDKHDAVFLFEIAVYDTLHDRVCSLYISCWSMNSRSLYRCFRHRCALSPALRGKTLLYYLYAPHGFFIRYRTVLTQSVNGLSDATAGHAPPLPQSRAFRQQDASAYRPACCLYCLFP